MTVQRTPLSVTASPTTEGRRPKRFAQTVSESRTTGSAPFSSSFAVITRPTSGVVPSIWNRSAVVAAIWSESASPLPVIVTPYPT